MKTTINLTKTVLFLHELVEQQIISSSLKEWFILHHNESGRSAFSIVFLKGALNNLVTLQQENPEFNEHPHMVSLVVEIKDVLLPYMIEWKASHIIVDIDIFHSIQEIEKILKF